MTEPERFALSALAANLIPDPKERRVTLQRMAAERRAERARFNARIAAETHELRQAQLTLAEAHLALAVDHERHVKQSAESPA